MILHAWMYEYKKSTKLNNLGKYWTNIEYCAKYDKKKLYY